MRKIGLTFLVGFSLMVFTACDKKSSGSNSNSGQIAVVPPADSCLNQPANCNSTPYQNSGFVPYNYNGNQYYDPNQGFCGCNNGYRPVVNGQWGMGCASLSLLQYYSSYNYYFAFWGISAPQGGTQQQSVVYNSNVETGAGWNNCYTTAVSTCNTGVPNACGAGNICRPIGGGSYLGACVKEIPQ